MDSEPTFEIEHSPAHVDDPVLAFYFDYWQRKRRGRKAPSRADIEPRELKYHLGNIMLTEALPGLDDFRFRLIGTRVTHYFLGDATGTTLREVHAIAGLPKELTDGLVALMRMVCETTSWVLLKGPHGEWMGHFYPAFQALYLPLSDDGVTVNMILSPFNFNYARLRAGRPEQVSSPI